MRDNAPVLNGSSRIGIVNRGEPAVRFIRAVREYNEAHGTSLRTVAFFLDEEADALFVSEADDSLPFSVIPGATQAGSVYLDRAVLIDGLRRAGCDGVWPGWGFVSEDADFARMVAEAGIVFLGPDHEAMALLGDKIAAKDLAERSDVPILPWSKREIGDLEDARAIAEQIGYPVIVKAAHAGGGRGIRFVLTPDQLESQLTSAREETKRITGDEIVFIERLVRTGRHLEVQCICDRHGNVHTFGVRDCSVQRRNQKIIEETPPPGMDTAEIAEIERAAARLMSASGYESAGTVEFLFDMERDEFYFMEVNTRLQVEHPITENLYGIDLVKGQIDVAFGNELRFPEKDPKGVVLEARLNAEDPDRDFTPSPGYVRYFRAPAGPGVRVDSGIAQESTIPSLFDSMVAKVIAHGSDRADAIARLRRALQETRIAIDGGTTNKAFLLSLLAQPEVVKGGVHTKWVEALLQAEEAKTCADAAVALIAAAVEAYNAAEAEDLDLFRRQIATYGHPRSALSSGAREVTFGYDGNAYRFAVRRLGSTLYEIEIDGTSVVAEYVAGAGESRLTYGGQRYAIQTIDRGGALQVEVDGIPCVLEQESGGAVKAPSPAVVLGLAVQEGAEVKKGDRLLSLEAMKMEMIVEAPADGLVKEISVAPGQQVAAGEVLVSLETSKEEGEQAAPAAEPVGFATTDRDREQDWRLTCASLAALFTGYDPGTDPNGEFERLLTLAEDDATSRERLFHVLYDLLETAVTIDSLFSKERINAEQFARLVSWEELAFIYFRYSMHGNETLPAEFVEVLNEALSRYPRGLDPEGSWAAFFRMQRTQHDHDAKLELVRSMIFTLENLPVPQGRHDGLLRLLDELIRLHQIEAPSLADAALHARYHLHERQTLPAVRSRRSERVRTSLRRLLALPAGSEDRQTLEQEVIDSSPSIVYELLAAYREFGGAERRAIPDLIARHFVRDRELGTVRTIDVPGAEVTLVTADGVKTYLLVVDGASGGGDAEDPISALEAAIAKVSSESATAESGAAPTAARPAATRAGSEAIVLYATDEGSTESDDELFARLGSTAVDADWLAVGLYRGLRSYEFRTFHRDDEAAWNEDRRKRSFSPLFYRELRVYRLSNFDTRVVYHSDSVYLVAITARNNPRDERLFALATASEAIPEVDRGGHIERVSEFDEVFMESVFKMRSEQAHRRRRLFWNRIIVHVRALIPLSAAQIKEYGGRIVPRTRELGLEKAVIYTRRKRWSEDVVRELELLFLNISEDQFTLRSRKPSDEPYKPMDRYVSNVVRSRQRKNVYPYEVVKMITYTGYPVSLNVPRGDFEEYDIEVDAAGNQKTVSVKGRPYGRNQSYIVFGVVKNQDPQSGLSYRRALVLSDATKDMGSLAEDECRRVIAAFDLAEAEGIPLEWVPISSGARIDMESGTENLDWTAAVIRRIVQFTQAGGEVNIIVSGINVGAQSYWNAEATMLMHTRGLLIMTDEASMLLTGKKALDFSGSVSAGSNVEIGGVERIMGPNGQSQIRVANLADAYQALFQHYRYAYVAGGANAPKTVTSSDPDDRDVGATPYEDRLGQGFATISDIFSERLNPERKKPFDMRQLMEALVDRDAAHLERWGIMKDAETAITWETRIGGYGAGLIGIESRPLARLGDVPHDGPESWSGGTLFPQSSKKVARALNAWSGRLPAVVLANLSGFDGSPESLRRLQLEYGAEIGRAVVNFEGPIVFVVVARYHGGAYVVFSKTLNPSLTAFALEGSFASVLGGAPAAAVVFPRQVEREATEDARYVEATKRLETDPSFTQRDLDEVYRMVHAEKQTALAQRFDTVHNIERAKQVGSIDEIITIAELRPRVIERIRAR
ncbi:MAG: carboxyl transferase domain-containing protein [Spirochaetota bacterium]